MSIIKPRTRGKRLVKHNMRLDEENQETLYAYARFIDESTEYVLNQLIDTVLAKDKDFARWRMDHPQSCVPHTVFRPRGDAPDAERTAATYARLTGAPSIS